MDEDLAVGMVGVGEAADTVEEVGVGGSSLAEEMFELIFGKGLKKLMKRLILLLINLALAIAAAFGRSFGCFGRAAAGQIGGGRRGGSSIRSKILILRLRLLFVVVFGWGWRRRLGFGGLGFQLSLLGHGDGRRNWGNTKRGSVGDGILYNSDPAVLH